MNERKETALTTQNKHHEQTVNADMCDSNNPKRILLVEDDMDLREIIGETLERCGHTTIRAASQEEALQILEEGMPDLILLDVMLPDGNGLDICRRTAGRRDSDKSPVVFILSGNTRLECKLNSFLCGAKRFFAKPFDMDELIEAVNRTALPKTATHTSLFSA